MDKLNPTNNGSSMNIVQDNIQQLKQLFPDVFTEGKVDFDLLKSTLGEYLEKRQCLKGLVVLMDIRHPLKDLDMDLIQWAADSDLPVLTLLTKSDKLSQGKRSAEVLKVKKALKSLDADITVQAFSSLKKTGVEQANEIICNWLSQDQPTISDDLYD